MTTFSEISARLDALAIEVPSWAYGNSGTRFKVFGSPGTPRSVEEKIADAAKVHELTGLAPSVALHLPWDLVEDFGALRRYAEDIRVTTAVADDLASATVRVRVELDGAGGAVSARIEGVGELARDADGAFVVQVEEPRLWSPEHPHLYDLVIEVAVVRPGFVLHPNPDEVAHAFEVPLAFLMNPAHHRRHRMEWGGQMREWFSMPYLERVRIERGTGESAPTPESEVERFIWGATAGMLRNFYRFLSA